MVRRISKNETKKSSKEEITKKKKTKKRHKGGGEEEDEEEDEEEEEEEEEEEAAEEKDEEEHDDDEEEEDDEEEARTGIKTRSKKHSSKNKEEAKRINRERIRSSRRKERVRVRSDLAVLDLLLLSLQRLQLLLGDLEFLRVLVQPLLIELCEPARTKQQQKRRRTNRHPQICPPMNLQMNRTRPPTPMSLFFLLITRPRSAPAAS